MIASDISRLDPGRLVQSKLFQKFLSEESFKKQSPSKPLLKENPQAKPKQFRLNISPSKAEINPPTPQEISVESSRLYSEHSEIQGFSQHIFASSPEKAYLNYPEYPMYMSFAGDSKNTEKIKEESERLKQEFVQVLNEKDSEILKLRKELEGSRLDYMELEDRFKAETGQESFELEQKIASLVEQNQKLLDFNRNSTLEAKNRMNDLEAETRLVKQRNEELIKDYLREKEKNDMLEVRIATLKERSSLLENTNMQMQDRIISLERELESVNREIGYLRKRPEPEVFLDLSPNTTRNCYDDYQRPRLPNEDHYTRPRNSSNMDQHWPRVSQDRSPLQRQSLEQKLDSLIQDKQRLEKEFNKLPEVCKNLAAKRRKEELDLELEIIDTNIHNLKSKIRSRIRQIN
jgi:hypothetical protein